MAVTSYNLGFGGWCILKFGSSSYYVPLTNGSVDRSFNVAFQNTYHVPFSDKGRSKIRLNYGTLNFSGNLSFELTKGLSNFFFAPSGEKEPNDFFNRKTVFDVIVCDGMKVITMRKCVWNNFDINGSTNGTINCSISFQSVNNYKEQFQVSNWENREIVLNDSPEKYWQYGVVGQNNEGTGINTEGKIYLQSFNISFQRNCVPVFLNNDNLMPTYIRVGIIECSATITSLENWLKSTTIKLGSHNFSFINEYKQSENWQFGGVNGEGMKTYKISGSNVASSEIFKIT